MTIPESAPGCSPELRHVDAPQVLQLSLQVGRQSERAPLPSTAGDFVHEPTAFFEGSLGFTMQSRLKPRRTDLHFPIVTLPASHQLLTSILLNTRIHKLPHWAVMVTGCPLPIGIALTHGCASACDFGHTSSRKVRRSDSTSERMAPRSSRNRGRIAQRRFSGAGWLRIAPIAAPMHLGLGICPRWTIVSKL